MDTTVKQVDIAREKRKNILIRITRGQGPLIPMKMFLSLSHSLMSRLFV